ncbi:MAG TPA: pyridoxal 5'-phosphate synthase glutaminase subunit PdxT [Candidatus Nitrosopolaris rasttigaisensis]|nr:pyridoxal 5'-phosphate synthase glutaminase subunit PdxT [Candidatus Nitrosopolaris rasttigaisensis]
MKTKISVGVLGIQGDIEENKTVAQEALNRSNVKGNVKFVRYAEEIEKIDGLILPGGESTVISTLATIQGGILHTIKRRIAEGMPALGTCAGMIMLAKRAYDRVVGETRQQLLSNLDIVVERNAFGRQDDSFEAKLSIPILGKNNKFFKGVFIRAPIVIEVGAAVDIIAKFNNRIVGVRQGNIIGTSFHPELSDDDRIHRQFIKTVLDCKRHKGAQQI